MGYQLSSKRCQSEARLQEAILAYQRQQFPSVRATAKHFEVSHRTLGRRLAGGSSVRMARENKQILSVAEEKTLVRWITRYSIAGSHVSPALLIEIAELVRARRVRRESGDSTSTTITDRIGHEWIYRFLNRYPEIQGLYARQMESSRFDGATYDVLERWFNAFASLMEKHSYAPQNVWNMDESGFGVG
jgi:hypothetical protein